jgi:hypothetical protein
MYLCASSIQAEHKAIRNAMLIDNQIQSKPRGKVCTETTSQQPPGCENQNFTRNTMGSFVPMVKSMVPCFADVGYCLSETDSQSDPLLPPITAKASLAYQHICVNHLTADASTPSL